MGGNDHPVDVSLFSKAPYKLDFTPVIELTRGPSVFVAATNASTLLPGSTRSWTRP